MKVDDRNVVVVERTQITGGLKCQRIVSACSCCKREGMDSLDFYDNLLIDFYPMRKKNLFSFLFMNRQYK